jgi:hypothetical protein
MRDYDKVESTDDDWALISYRRMGGLKRVRHYHGDNAAPPALGALEDEFDRIVDSGRFVGVPSVSATPTSPTPVVPVPVSAEGGPGAPAKTPHPSENAAAPDETAADPDNHP